MAPLSCCALLIDIENPIFLKTILKARKRFDSLRSFTLESGQEEIERLSRLRKTAGESSDRLSSPLRGSRASSLESGRGLPGPRTPSLSNVPEEGGTFTIGDNEDSEDEGHERQTPPSHSSPSGHTSRTPSMSSVDDAVPLQLRGMSEKARGKMPVGIGGQLSFSRVNSIGSLNSPPTPTVASVHGFLPTAHWVLEPFPQ